MFYPALAGAVLSALAITVSLAGLMIADGRRRANSEKIAAGMAGFVQGAATAGLVKRLIDEGVLDRDRINNVLVERIKRGDAVADHLMQFVNQETRKHEEAS